MNKYQVYYHLKSINKFRGVHESTPLNNIDEAISLIDSLSAEEDSISIYTTESKVRVQIWGEVEREYCALEINNALHGVNYYKKLLKERLKKIDAEVLENYIARPKNHGFLSEGF